MILTHLQAIYKAQVYQDKKRLLRIDTVWGYTNKTYPLALKSS